MQFGDGQFLLLGPGIICYHGIPGKHIKRSRIEGGSQIHQGRPHHQGIAVHMDRAAKTVTGGSITGR